MKISTDHLLEGAKLDLLPGGSVMAIRRLLVIHFTSGMSAQSSIEFWKSREAKGACAHLIIDRDGTIFQCRAFNRTAGHAGVSSWSDPATKTRDERGKPTPLIRTGCNAFSIGIELANAGDAVTGSVENPKLFRKYKCEAAISARHKNGGPVSLWEVYSDQQLAACFDAAAALVERYKLDDVRGHDDIAPQRKNDPGPAFPMDRLRAKLFPV